MSGFVPVSSGLPPGSDRGGPADVRRKMPLTGNAVCGAHSFGLVKTRPKTGAKNAASGRSTSLGKPDGLSVLRGLSQALATVLD